MDASITYMQSRCLWKLLQFFGSELFSPSLTNIKAFLIGYGGLQACNYIIENNIVIPQLPKMVLPTMYFLSIVTITFESFGLISRFFTHYDLFCYKHFNTCYVRTTNGLRHCACTS